MTTLLISDLHLDPERPRITGAFLHFLASRAASADHLYILGDLFESWIGDDDDSELASQVIKGLADLVSNNTKVYFMAGNRDFLVGNTFARHTGVELLDEPSRIQHNQQKILLMHGDSLCTDDIEYQAFRKQVRSKEWQTDFLQKPIQERRDIANMLREKSREANTLKDSYIMDVNQQAVLQVLDNEQTDLLIHGHTHRPARHQVNCNGIKKQRIVLGDWSDTHGWYIALDDGKGPELVRFSFVGAA